jgi:hypothetical protein
MTDRKFSGIISLMHNVFYASGFLYHPLTQQILLQQLNEDDATFSTFIGKNKKNETAVDTFKRIIEAQLDVSLSTDDINEVYDYHHDNLEEHYYFLYATVNDTIPTASHKGVTWVTLKQLPKLKLHALTRQDIIVGQRVINLFARQEADQEIEKLNQQT